MIPANRPATHPTATTAPKPMDQTIPLSMPEPIAEGRKPMVSSRPCILRVIARRMPMPKQRLRPVATMAGKMAAETAEAETDSRSTMAAVAASNVFILIRSDSIPVLSVRCMNITGDTILLIRIPVEAIFRSPSDRHAVPTPHRPG